MLFQITDKCLEECSHCFVNGSSRGTTMISDYMFNHALQLAKSLGSSAALISGGEPTEHPNWRTLVQRACQSMPAVVLLTNGRFYHQQWKVHQLEMLLRGFPNLRVQITSNPKYYPNHQDTVANAHRLTSLDPRRVEFFADGGSQLFPLGRARSNFTDFPKRQCLCINLYLLARQVPSLAAVVRALEIRGKFCTPTVNAFGQVLAGEGSECTSIGTVIDDVSQMFSRIRETYPCNRCGQFDKNDPRIKGVLS